VVVAVLAAALVPPVLLSNTADAAAYRREPLPGWGVDGWTYATTVVGDVLWVGGNFANAVGPDGSTVPRRNLAAFDAATGALLAANPDPDGRVRALATDGTNLFVGGSFDTIGGQNRQRAADLDPVDGTVGSWNPQPSATVLSVRADPTGSRIYIAGDFTSVNGQSRIGVAGTGPTGDLVGPAFASPSSPSLDVDLDDSGSTLFLAVGGSGNQVAAYDTTNGTLLWNHVAEGDVQAVHHRAGEVYFGFHEGIDGDFTQRMKLADASTGVIDPDFDPTFDTFSGVWDITSTPQQLVVAGDFTTVSGVEARRLARFPAVDMPPTTTTTTTTTTSTTTSSTTTTTSPPVAGTETTPVPFGSVWRYHDLGEDLGTGWTTETHPDDTWAAGPAPLGYGDNDITTVVSYGPDPTDKHRTTYFRHQFDVAALPTTATISLVVDDGAVVHLNGTEITRDNMPAGTIDHLTYAATSIEGSAETAVRTFEVPTELLHLGVNTLAVEVHQVWRGSSDIRLDVSLVTG
jgi:hypothetical protein